MATQAEIDTAAAKAKQGGGQAAVYTVAAKAKQNNNNQAAKDTAAAKSKQNGGDSGTSARMSQREAAAGLYLAGNNTISAGRGGVGPTFSDREAAAGLRDTMSGRVAMNATNPDFPPVGTTSGNEEFVSVRNNAGGGGGGALAGIEIIWADQSITFIEADTLTAGHTTEAYWSLVLTVSSGSFDKTLTYDATSDIFTTTGTAPSLVQTKYRFRLITQYTNGSGDVVSAPISAYGQYREVKICINGIGYQTLMKVT
jgi:hypothetical protein